jgi:ferritin-like metal-binding protein YciE
MADLNERDAKLVQYLSEAYGKERELETTLQAHIAMTNRAPYKKRLKDHLRETKAHAKAVDRRIKQLGGGGQRVQTAVGKAMAAAKGPMHMVRGSGEQEKLLKNAKTEYFNEHEEIATYLAIETLAAKTGDRETAKLARGIRREEERMAKFLEGQIKALTGAVVVEEVPAAQRRSATRKRSSTKRASSGAKRSTAKRASSGAKRSTAKRTSTKRASAKRASSSRKRSTKKASSSRKRPASRR